MRGKQQKQTEDLIFELIKGGSPFKQDKWAKQHLLNKIKQFKHNQKKSLLQMKKSILITKDNPLTSSRLQKRVSFIDQEEKKRLQSERIKRRLFEQKMNVDKQKNQLKQSIQATQSKVQCLIDNLFSKNQSNLTQSHLHNSHFQTITNLSSFNTDMDTSAYQPKSQIKYRYETSLKKQVQCQTIPIQNQPQFIILKYRYSNDGNPQIQTPINYSQRTKSSPKIIQSTVFTSTSPHSNSRYKDKPIKLSNFDQTQSQANMHRTYSVSDISKNQSKISFLTPKKNKSVLSLHQESSQWAKTLTQNKCRHQIDIQIMKHRLFDKIEQSKSKIKK